MSLCTTKPTKWPVHPAKTEISLGIHPVWSESSLCTHWRVKDPSFLHADSKDSDQTGRMPRLVRVVAGCTSHFVMRWLIYKFNLITEHFETLTVGLVRKWLILSVSTKTLCIPDKHKNSDSMPFNNVGALLQFILTPVTLSDSSQS